MIRTGCENARLACRICDVLQGGELAAGALEELGRGERGEYDPDVDPYFWEL